MVRTVNGLKLLSRKNYNSTILMDRFLLKDWFSTLFHYRYIIRNRQVTQVILDVPKKGIEEKPASPILDESI